MKKLILGAAFLTIGTFAMAQQTQKMQKMDPAQMEQKRMDKLKSMQSDLNLTDAQVAKIKALQDQKMAQMKQDAPKMQAERQAKMDQRKMQQTEYQNQMKSILTPAQYQKWEAQKQEQMKERGKMVKGNRAMKSDKMNQMQRTK